MFNLSVNDIIAAVFNFYIFSALFSIIAHYFVSYLISLAAYSGKDQETMLGGRALILNIILFPTIIYSIFTFGGSTSLNDFTVKFQAFLNNPTSIFSVLSFIVGFYLIIYIAGIPMTDALKPSSIAFIDMLAWLLFIVVLICDFFSIFLNISLSNLLNKSTTDTSANDTSTNSVTTTPANEVFNISNNLYTYENAAEVCSIYGAKLATYDQVEDAYNKGGEWCNYGWSQDQMALFPTQKSTWAKLQGSELTKNQCGRQGINGGYMENPLLLFGVNCYGKKPQATTAELKKMEANQQLAANVENIKENVIDPKIQFLKENRDTLLVVNSFNHQEWSEW